MHLVCSTLLRRKPALQTTSLQRTIAAKVAFRGDRYSFVDPVADGLVVPQQFLDPVGEEGSQAEVQQFFFGLVLQDQRIAGLNERP